MGLLANPNPDWCELASVAARDAAFSYALLSASPLARNEHQQELALLLANRLEHAGGDVLRAWLLHTAPLASLARPRERVLGHSLLTAECARQLAIHTAYPRPLEAYLAGLWHDLGRLWLLMAAPDYSECNTILSAEQALAAEERKRYGQDHAALSSRLAAEGGAPIQVVDAIALHHMLEEQAIAAHPLSRLLWAAEALAAEEHEVLLNAIGRVIGVQASALLGLRADAAQLCNASGANQNAAQGKNASLEALSDDGRTPSSRSSLVPVDSTTSLAMPGDYWRNVAMQGLLQGCFRGASDEMIGRRLGIACRLLFRRSQPFIVTVGPDDRLTAAPLPGHEDTRQLFDELHLDLDDATSALALAARTAAATTCFPDSTDPGRSPRDWHLARWLQVSGLLCVPCGAPERHVAVIGIEDNAECSPSEQAHIAVLAAAASGILLEKRRRAAAEAGLQADLAQRYREHARRVVHEVNNPLTVIRSYLDMIGQRGDTDESLRSELAILNGELDRVGSLLQGVTQAPKPKPEEPRSHLAEVLQELRALYGEALFSRRNIELDVRAAPGLPPARIPPSVLKQVLLNLFRNASEALHDGGKLSVSAPGTLIANGIPCVEMRLIDNGPGIQTDRLARLFEPAPSAKTGHQGVGLSICRELLATWQSSIVCRSQSGSGTCFQIFIPVD